MQINELNDKYYVLYGELYEAKAVLPVKQYETMCKALYEQYCRELEVVVGKINLETGRDVFELRFKLRNYIPRRRWFFRWNKIAKVLLKKFKAEFLKELNALDKKARKISRSNKKQKTEQCNALAPVKNEVPSETQ